MHKNTRPTSSWVEKGLIESSQFGIQTLHDPVLMNVEMSILKDQIREKYSKHLEWLRPIDTEGRATFGFESTSNRLIAIENLTQKFWNKILPLDKYYNANLDSFPELVDLLAYQYNKV